MKAIIDLSDSLEPGLGKLERDYLNRFLKMKKKSRARIAKAYFDRGMPYTETKKALNVVERTYRKELT